MCRNRKIIKGDQIIIIEALGPKTFSSFSRASQVMLAVKNPLLMQEMQEIRV